MPLPTGHAISPCASAQKETRSTVRARSRFWWDPSSSLGRRHPYTPTDAAASIMVARGPVPGAAAMIASRTAGVSGSARSRAAAFSAGLFALRIPVRTRDTAVEVPMSTESDRVPHLCHVLTALLYPCLLYTSDAADDLL